MQFESKMRILSIVIGVLLFVAAIALSLSIFTPLLTAGATHNFFRIGTFLFSSYHVSTFLMPVLLLYASIILLIPGWNTQTAGILLGSPVFFLTAASGERLLYFVRPLVTITVVKDLVTASIIICIILFICVEMLLAIFFAEKIARRIKKAAEHDIVAETFEAPIPDTDFVESKKNLDNEISHEEKKSRASFLEESDQSATKENTDTVILDSPIDADTTADKSELRNTVSINTTQEETQENILNTFEKAIDSFELQRFDSSDRSAVIDTTGTAAGNVIGEFETVDIADITDSAEDFGSSDSIDEEHSDTDFSISENVEINEREESSEDAPIVISLIKENAIENAQRITVAEEAAMQENPITEKTLKGFTEDVQTKESAKPAAVPSFDPSDENNLFSDLHELNAELDKIVVEKQSAQKLESSEKGMLQKDEADFDYTPLPEPARQNTEEKIDEENNVRSTEERTALESAEAHSAAAFENPAMSDRKAEVTESKYIETDIAADSDESESGTEPLTDFEDTGTSAPENSEQAVREEAAAAAAAAEEEEEEEAAEEEKTSSGEPQKKGLYQKLIEKEKRSAEEKKLAAQDVALLHTDMETASEIEEALAKNESSQDRGKALEEEKQKLLPKKKYAIPFDLLNNYPDGEYWVVDEGTKRSAIILKETFNEFKIQVKITGIKKGPVVTMFELLPPPGIKLSKITNLQDNIALRLAASSVRIVAPIPGKHAVGIEVPNKKRSIVSFRELIESDLPEAQKMAIPVVLGKDVTGDPQLLDLAQTPHLLIAGATGSGKSVCVNSIILSILYNRRPDEVKLILVDPKIVELKLYNDIGHLLTPVITEPKRAFQALQYCLCEMERRYALLDNMGCRDIRSYNAKIKEEHIATERLPYVVIIIDEFADLMATSGKELEATVARLCAMSRAVGIHVVLATQRPSIDVITGLIKANIPTRIAFMVASKTDSRIILDEMGADKLLGKGDMLYVSPVKPFPMRIQGTFVSEEEVERVVSCVKQFGEPEYIDDEIFVDDDDDDFTETLFPDDEDPLYDQALEIVLLAGKASASYIQRKLKIGYNRAARLVEEMEHRGIVGPANGSKPRDVLYHP
ncbi:FtsK/SpoIIIE family protein [Treponema phagedenis]|uniref:FtsK/SpoIIIE family protein n=1 Tax=Treponema phagedenis TaxID=162 RepID=A0A0B7GXG1_TREPH|nr:DNA translocase FtsK [Treponema phagedenis]CEM62277.1 FtsK/SpoIIIE family protein [Treponema phagedenis]